MKKIFLVLLCAFVFSQHSLAQTSTSAGMTGFRRGLATIMLSGLGGAILGLSTLSFYGDPQEHIGNIWTGLAIGALGGASYVIVQNQKNSSLALDPFPESNRMKWAQQGPPIFRYSWEF